MRPVKGFADAKVYKEFERLPAGGYVIKILNVEFEDNSAKGYKDNVILSFDIAEGEHKDFYKNNFQQQKATTEDPKWKGIYRMRVPKDDGSDQDDWTQRRFKTDIVAFEASNEGFHWDWDEQKLKGRIVGALFNNKEYEFNGRRGFFTNCHSLTDAERIRQGKFRIPADKLLQAGASGAGTSEGPTDWMNIPEGVDDEALPFN